MKRSAFTLVELIFVIVIIGILAAVAIPQFKNLKQNAEVKAVIKTTIDTASGAANAAVNQNDLENNTSAKLGDLVSLHGKGWVYDEVTDKNGSYSYTAAGGAAAAAKITLDTDHRTVTYYVTCANFPDAISQNKCKSDTNSTTGIPSTIINY